MIDFYRVATLKDSRQVAGQSDTCHLGSMARGVVSPPPRLDGMEVMGGKGRLKQSMSSINTRIEQTHVRCPLVVFGESCTCQEIVKPCTLLVACKGIKELRRFLRPSQLGDAVQRDHGTLHLFKGCPDQQHDPLGKPHFALRYLHSLAHGSFSKVVWVQRRIPDFDIRWMTLPPQPHFPPQLAFFGGRERRAIVRPKRSNACRSDLLDGINQTPVVTGAAGTIPLSLHVVANEAFEMA